MRTLLRATALWALTMLTALTVLVTPAAWGAPAASTAPASRIAVIGDSYTTGSTEGGVGPSGWAPRVWQMLATQGFNVTPEVSAEGGAGYAIRGNHGSLFGDLTPRAVRPDDDTVRVVHACCVVAADAGASNRLDRGAHAHLAPHRLLRLFQGQGRWFRLAVGRACRHAGRAACNGRHPAAGRRGDHVAIVIRDGLDQCA